MDRLLFRGRRRVSPEEGDYVLGLRYTEVPGDGTGECGYKRKNVASGNSDWLVTLESYQPNWLVIKKVNLEPWTLVLIVIKQEKVELTQNQSSSSRCIHLITHTHTHARTHTHTQSLQGESRHNKNSSVSWSLGGSTE